MSKLTLADIEDLRAYERDREVLRLKVIEQKRVRRVSLGPVVSVVFENKATIRHQVQEMARAERMLEDHQIQTELDTYNPLIPEPGELSMTLFIELVSETELHEWLPKLVGIERSLSVRIGEGDGAIQVANTVDPAHAANLTREDVTAAVHFVKIALQANERERFMTEPCVLVCDLANYRYVSTLSDATKEALARDWND